MQHNGLHVLQDDFCIEISVEIEKKLIVSDLLKES